MSKPETQESSQITPSPFHPPHPIPLFPPPAPSLVTYSLNCHHRLLTLSASKLAPPALSSLSMIIQVASCPLATYRGKQTPAGRSPSPCHIIALPLSTQTILNSRLHPPLNMHACAGFQACAHALPSPCLSLDITFFTFQVLCPPKALSNSSEQPRGFHSFFSHIMCMTPPCQLPCGLALMIIINPPFDLPW